MSPTWLRPSRLLAPAGALLLALPLAAAVQVAPVFGSHMVLQQELPLPVWGWADPGEVVTVRLDDQSSHATADAKGCWKVVLAERQADGKPHTLTISGSSTITCEDVLLGEVWLGSGQSNMAASLGTDAGRAPEPGLRLLTMPVALSKKPEREATPRPQWSEADATTASRFSAVLWHFGCRLHRELKVPIGLVCSAKGSTNIAHFLPGSGPFYNGSIVPLQPFALRGLLWYQGEANVMAGDGLGYAGKLRFLIEGWRTAWDRELPFYLVQIAPLRTYKPDLLPPLWEAQTACLKLPRTGMAVANDLDDRQLGNIHPHNKDKVGERLALWALAKEYGRTLEYCGPLFRALTVEGGRVRVRFAHAQALTTRDGKPPGDFELAAAEGAWVGATAAIDGESVVLSAPGLAAPVKARFAWRNDATPNLVNGAGLPASAFHSDGWSGGTAE